MGIGLSPLGSPFDPAAARKLMEIANSVEAVQEGRIFIEKINWPFLSELKGTPSEYKAGLDLAIAKGWLWHARAGPCEIHEPGAAMFA